MDNERRGSISDGSKWGKDYSYEDIMSKDEAYKAVYADVSDQGKADADDAPENELNEADADEADVIDIVLNHLTEFAEHAVMLGLAEIDEFDGAQILDLGVDAGDGSGTDDSAPVMGIVKGAGEGWGILVFWDFAAFFGAWVSDEETWVIELDLVIGDIGGGWGHMLIHIVDVFASLIQMDGLLWAERQDGELIVKAFFLIEFGRFGI